MYYVYKITILETNEYYFGGRYSKKSSPHDLGKTYFTSSTEVQRLLFTYGKDKCKFEILFTSTDKKATRKFEENLISEHLNFEKCLNRKRGFPVGYVHSEERNKKISEKVKLHWQQNYETRSNQNKGRSWKLSKEKAAKVSNNLKKFNKETAKICSGTIWITNGTNSKRINSKDKIPEGYLKGRSTH